MTGIGRGLGKLLRPQRDSARRSSGQSLVETALILPFILSLFLLVGDAARAFTAMIAVESAAREAADWGAYRPGNWSDVDSAECSGEKIYECTVKRMETVARSAASRLPDVSGSNPQFECFLYDSLTSTTAQACAPSLSTTCSEKLGPEADPCRLEVKMTYTLDLIFPLCVPIGDGCLFNLPDSVTFTRSSTFAIADQEGT